MNKILKKFLEFAVGDGIVFILGVLSIPIISRLIDPNQNGKLSMFTTYTGLATILLAMGLDQAYIRYYNEEKEENRARLLKVSLKYPLIINLALGAVVLLLYKQVSNIIIGEVSIYFIILFIIHIIASIIGRFAIVHIRMKQKGRVYSLLNITNKSSYLIFMFIMFYIFRGNYITVVLATVISNIIMVSLAIFYSRDDWFNSSDKVLNVTTKELFDYGVPFIFSMTIVWVFQSIDRISIKHFCDFTEVGLYSGAMLIISLLNAIQGAFTTFWVPLAYERYSNNPDDKKFFIMVNEIISLVMLMISVGLIASKDIIILLLGRKYYGSQFIFPFLVLMPIMYTISETTVLGINFKKKSKYHVYIAMISALTNVVGNLILVPTYKATGAAISTGIAYIIFFIGRTYYGNKLYKIKFSLCKLWVCIVGVYILAWYSSLHKFDMIILILTIIDILVILFSYRDLVSDGISMINKNIRRKL